MAKNNKYMSGWSSVEGSPRHTEVTHAVLLYFSVQILHQAGGWAGGSVPRQGEDRSCCHRPRKLPTCSNQEVFLPAVPPGRSSSFSLLLADDLDIDLLQSTMGAGSERRYKTLGVRLKPLAGRRDECLKPAAAYRIPPSHSPASTESILLPDLPRLELAAQRTPFAFREFQDRQDP
ncbi:hypothetical protein EYF80_033660 [Liparis tanakae]|uniref:Uncharacterized protein n=1 Tax=Liparis tanakae TaxID=230148 RepID=A0A4Z2GS89_9TELE|nr:hypothetical protein EYF80_033660 [Liparis tanakae]